MAESKSDSRVPSHPNPGVKEIKLGTTMSYDMTMTNMVKDKSDKPEAEFDVKINDGTMEGSVEGWCQGPPGGVLITASVENDVQYVNRYEIWLNGEMLGAWEYGKERPNEYREVQVRDLMAEGNIIKVVSKILDEEPNHVKNAGEIQWVKVERLGPN